MLIVTPNLSFDMTIRLAALTPGTVVRASDTTTTAGGKGVNVARAATILGSTDVHLTGFIPARDGRRLREFLAAEGIPVSGVDADGTVRVASILVEDSGRVTLINGRGPQITTSQWAVQQHTVRERLRTEHGPLICSGSLPPGVPDSGYAELVALAHAAGVAAIVDAAPAPLAAALAQRPDLVSPNLSEAEGLLLGRVGEESDERGPDIEVRALAAARGLHQAGAVRAVVTAGGSGAALATAAGAWWLTAPRIDVVSPIGAGDSFVAGAARVLASRPAGDPASPEADIAIVVEGMATASASCLDIRPGVLDPADVPRLRAAISVHPAG